MSAAVYNLLRRGGFRSAAWTNQELAELFRVADVLKDAGLPIETDSGLSDEGDPWFIFCRTDSGDVIAHFARIDGDVVACGLPRNTIFRGRDFREVARRLLSDQPLVMPSRHDDKTTFLHPAAIITAFVATALLYSTEGRAESGALTAEDGTLREVLEPSSSAIFSFLAHGEARADSKLAEQNTTLSQISLLSIISAMLVVSAGQEALAAQVGGGEFDFADATRSLGEQSTIANGKAVAALHDGALGEGADGAETAFGLEQLLAAADGAAAGAHGGESFLLALARSIDGSNDMSGSQGGDGGAAARAVVPGEGGEMRGLGDADLGDDILSVSMAAADVRGTQTAAGARETQDDAGKGEAASSDGTVSDDKAASAPDGSDLDGFNLRDGGLVFETGSGSSGDQESFVLAFTKSAFAALADEPAGTEAFEQPIEGEGEGEGEGEALPDPVAEDGNSETGQLDQGLEAGIMPPAPDSPAPKPLETELPAPEPAKPEPIVFSGGFLLIEDFKVGVDVLLIDDSVLDPASAVVQKHGLDLIMDFGQQGMIALVGAMDSFVDVA